MEANRKSLEACLPEKREWVLNKCNELWSSILKAKGFPQGFGNFISDVFPVIPLACPQLTLITAIKEYMMDFYHKEEKKFIIKTQRQKSNDIRNDMAQKGGRMAFRMLKEHDKHISSVFQQKTTFTLLKQRIHAKGQHVLLVEDASLINISEPLIYGKQCVRVKKTDGNKIFLEQPIFLKHAETELCQFRATVQDSEKADMALAFWNRCWQTDDPEENSEVLATAQNILNSIPTWMPYQGEKASVYQLKEALKGTKKKNMRGS